jgi:plastocyanin
VKLVSGSEFLTMKILTCILGASLAAASACPAGTISGTVRGAPPAAGAPAGPPGAYESRRYKYVEKIDYDQLRDFVVYLDQELPAGAPGAPTLATVTTTQKDANFEPHVLPVVVGSRVRWPNEDDIFHNVFSMAEAAPFDLGYYKKERTPEVVFEKVGQVDVFCAIHTKMHCIILVVPNRFFAKADDAGRFTIPGIPAGTYRFKAWHERLPPKILAVTVPAEGVVSVDVVLSLGDLPKY